MSWPALVVLAATLAPRQQPACGVLAVPEARRAAFVRADSVFQSRVAAHIPWPRSAIEERLLREYGAPIAAADSSVQRPPRAVLWQPAAVDSLQRSLDLDTLVVGADTLALQAVAARALSRAIERARRRGLALTPRGGRTAALRAAGDTEGFWRARVERGLRRLAARGVVATATADSILRLPAAEQVAAVLELESRGHCFGGAGGEKTILQSVAAPGSSQHLFGYAVDVTQHADARVRAVLAESGFRQTVLDDQPHFTYLGTTSRGVLRRHGLVEVSRGGRTYWVPPPGR